jgi:hypothetical protein
MRQRSKLSSGSIGATDGVGVTIAATLAGLFGSACPPGPVATALELPTGPRRPDGVTIESPAALPAPVDRARAEGVVALKERVSDATIRAAASAFLDAFAAHDVEALDRSLSRSARHLDAHGGSSFQVLADELVRRLRLFEASGVDAVHVERIDRFFYRDLGDGGARPRPSDMRPDDILVRAHLLLPRPSGERLLGDVVVLLLRWEEDAGAGDKRSLKVVGFDEE